MVTLNAKCALEPSEDPPSPRPPPWKGGGKEYTDMCVLNPQPITPPGNP